MNHSQLPKTKERLEQLLRQYKEYNEASDKADKERIGDEMTYADPVVWIMYKHAAYLGSDHEITTMGALREHSEEHGGICAKRFHFLSAFINEKYGKDIRNAEEFSDKMRIEDFYGSETMDIVVSDEDFMHDWQKYEYYKKDGRVAKWQNYTV
jgi:hypothetical protein